MVVRRRPGSTLKVPSARAVRSVGRGQLGGPVDAAQQRGNPGHDLAHPERLGEVVVGADAEADQDVGLVVAGGEHQHRDRALGLDPSAHLVPVEPGQHHVEQHHRRVGLGRQRHGRGAVEGLGHDVALGTQPLGHLVVDDPVVLDHQHPLTTHARTRFAPCAHEAPAALC